MQLALLLLLVASLATAQALLIGASRRPQFKLHAFGLNHVSDTLQHATSMLNAVVEAKPDGYVYGAVAAPDFALPLGLVLIIGTAAIPLLLNPGEKALEQQRLDEETRGVKFGRKTQNTDDE